METFHEDILQTFIFCFLASLGVIQIMVGIRGWHGLSIYGGRVRRIINYSTGTALLIFAYAWYFSNPQHRNVRNIEGFMSMVCLVLGIAAAAAVTAILASGSEELLRRFGRGATPSEGTAPKKLSLPDGTVLLSSERGEAGKNLVVLAEPGKGCEKVLRRLHASLPQGWGFLSFQPSGWDRVQYASAPAADWVENSLKALERMQDLQTPSLGGETFMGLGWGANELIRLRSRLERIHHPRAFLEIAPVVPDYSRGLMGDSFLSNTPSDICTILLREKPWKKKASRALTRLWWPVAAACIILATLITFIFDIRWKLFSGPMVGLVLSLWITYFLASWRGLLAAGKDRETQAAMDMRSPLMEKGKPMPLVVIASEESSRLATLPGDEKPVDPFSRIQFWNDVLRGKFLYNKGTLPRLINLICGEGE
jgi:hypothetical protein